MTGRPGGERPHVTVVFAGQSESWAKWIEHQIRAAGRATTLVRWNPLLRPPATDALTGLLEAPGRILLLIDDWYERLGADRFEAWAAALREVLPAHRDRIAAVSITAQPLPEAVIALAPVELRGLRPEAARSRVLECAGIAAPTTLVALDRGPRFPDDLPEVWNAQRRNRRFTGRTRLLEQIHDTFAAAGPDGCSLALHGPGGIGKTQLALEYVHRFAGDYDIVWWVTAGSRVTAREQFAALAPQLGIEASGQLEPVIGAVRRELVGTARPWLLVLDGADAPEKVLDLIPEGRGHVLVTTLRAEWAAHTEAAVLVPPFRRSESVAFVGRRAARLTESEADGLAEAVEDMPLLLDQMAAWLDVTPTADVPGYIKDIRRGKPDRFGIVESRDYPESFQVAWAKTLNTLRDGAAPAWQLLNLLACFSPDVVPVRLLQTARHGDLPRPLAELVSEPSSWNTALRRLSEITSMRVEYEPGRMDIQRVSTLRMHRLFHRYVIGIQSPRDRERYSEAARKVLVTADPRDPASPANWARYAELIPHLKPSGALESEDDDVRDLVLNCIDYLRMRGEYRAGSWLSHQAVEHWRPVSGPTHRSVLVALHQQANMLRRLGHYSEAEAVGRDTLERLTATGDARPIEVIRARDGLGGTLMALGRYDEARDLFEAAAERAAAELGGEDIPRTLTIRSNLAVALGLQGRYTDALALHRRILEARVELLGGKNPLTLYSALRTAWTLRLLGNYTEAMDIQGHNSRLHSQVLDRNHGQTLHAEHNLALCARRTGDLQFALAMMRKVREKLLSRRGSQDPDALMVSCDYAMLLRQLGRPDEARELAETTAALYEAQLGDSHPYAIGARANVGLLLRDAGELRAALAVTLRTRGQMARAVGPDHPWTLGCALNAAAVLALSGDTEAAAELGRDAAERSARTLGDSHGLTRDLRAGLALDRAGPSKTSETSERGRLYWDFEPQPI
ncbi:MULTISPECIES: FxSxx-COOH system tetratricopeptide repeat protein [Streptomyces]|uniref:FxSxx-COOH system tetratricopeptide repeat protein n=1 Tax=Streptomyces TaxID=1883 RepID=UPI001E37CC1E|nr:MULTISPECIES: FxSxx-COOH system tetratricopeptide repeat protein [Streptomyces]UFQ18014.1 tetratricopeptide repeat protein [Streptomyces huasconensis]WCL87625.1 FxSxx-COOH system tetratricopeptide repeat protein [Streptomyces sp. JCM 35825]